ncbi:toll/interleukin-1 receptor domain-containing protein [Amycolatopsis sp. SID8362]|uniref:toll/interleukin-1 receptor domain-containing protein n=1 Tax=Amycolatopsis sp. SID8362 TaxID=2690346 RepID=UPI00136E1AB5|nr:toll/interleukin-1 receptor domain-containing protein [Amycolatopsis sp. SID8362]NBH12448.1 TIR domain-containing protein [Amycolatopsis sp. SID8362]NED49140.1 toll/interleukin-1 receptor domain-containing protein [Amycolatopsis sp. SID8362]
MSDGLELFIAHASEDKDSLVRPLAAYLTRAGVKVWYDEFSLKAGDSLSRSIDKGLATARHGLVVLSPAFLTKRWPEYELRGLTAKEIAGGEKVVIPVWHNVDVQDVLAFSPPLADKFAVRSKDRDLEDIAAEILRVIRPDLGQQLSVLRRLLRRPGPDAEIVHVPATKLGVMPRPKVVEAEAHIAIRAANIVNTLGRANPKVVGDFMTFVADLYRDLHPEVELRVWELITAVFILVDGMTELSPEQRERLVHLLVMISLDNLDELDRAELPEHVVALTVEKWLTFSDVVKNERVRFSTEGMPDD